MLEFNNKNILVLGLKKSGLGAIKLLKTIDTNIFISDIKLRIQIEGTTYLEYDRLKSSLKKIDFIIKSPGIPKNSKVLKYARKQNIIIISEIELAYHFLDKKKVIVGITGTNGKTTTTSLITEILTASNIAAVSCGNIGRTFSECLLDYPDADVYCIELSSFQLDDIIYFKPHISIFLNLSKAHLDYHKRYENYINAKFNLIKNIKKDSIVIYNADDKIVRNRVKRLKCQKFNFSLYNEKSDVYLKQDLLRYNGYMIINKNEIKLMGMHNLGNVLASILTAKVFYIENEIINQTLKTFESLPHRIEFVNKINGVTYYNDSKSTNVSSTICALNAFNKPVILILGGFDRKQNFKTIITHNNLKIIIAIGQTKIRIAKLARKLNKETIICTNLHDGVEKSLAYASDNDIVLFSPASASFDEYPNYIARGDHFIEIVNNMVKITSIKQEK